MAKEEKKSKKGSLVIIIVCIIAMAIGGAAGFFLFSKNNSTPEVVEQVLPLDEFLVNIKGSNNTYVKFGVAITYDGNVKNLAEKLNSNLHKIRDGIISIFKDKTVDYMKDSQGLDVIKNEIKTKIDTILGDSKVLSVYFTNFLLH